MYRVRTEFNGLVGAPWISTMYFSDGGGSAAQAVAAVGTFWGSVDNVMDSEVDWRTLPDVETVDEATGNVTAVTQVTPVTGSGSLAAEALPIATQGLIRWRTGVYVSGREIRGRTFIPGLTETANDNGAPSAAVIGVLGTAGATLVSDANSVLVIWSRKNATAPPVVTTSTWGSFAVLRSRRD